MSRVYMTKLVNSHVIIEVFGAKIHQNLNRGNSVGIWVTVPTKSSRCRNLAWQSCCYTQTSVYIKTVAILKTPGILNWLVLTSDWQCRPKLSQKSGFDADHVSGITVWVWVLLSLIMFMSGWLQEQVLRPISHHLVIVFNKISTIYITWDDLQRKGKVKISASPEDLETTLAVSRRNKNRKVRHASNYAAVAFKFYFHFVFTETAFGGHVILGICEFEIYIYSLNMTVESKSI